MAFLAAAWVAAAGVTACTQNSCEHTYNCGDNNDYTERNEGPDSGSGSTTAPSSPGTTATSSPEEPSPPADAGATLPTDTGVPSRRFLAELPAVQLEPSDTKVDEGAMVDGDSYDHSITFVCDLYCNNGQGEKPQSSVSFNLGGRYQTLTLKMAVLDSSPDENEQGTFEVYLDGESQGAKHVGFGKAEAQTLEVTGVNRIRLVAYRPGTVANSLLAGVNAAGGTASVLPHLAWLNPELHR
ncbi:NPCBM/NEW2 domain-containing protein [Streptomyces sp. NPDC048564]|uniref:NPCBM/NEW2 domain-containing protein n=1 Tax=Streptomyces sp. NPDC048564 TaxID=3155760 RepID=UPI0034492225